MVRGCGVPPAPGISGTPTPRKPSPFADDLLVASASRCCSCCCCLIQRSNRVSRKLCGPWPYSSRAHTIYCERGRERGAERRRRRTQTVFYISLSLFNSSLVTSSPRARRSETRTRRRGTRATKRNTRRCGSKPANLQRHSHTTLFYSRTCTGKKYVYTESLLNYIYP